MYSLNPKKHLFFHFINHLIVISFLITSLTPPTYAQVSASTLNLPGADTLITSSGIFSPAIITGITIHPNDPLEMSFIINPGDENLDADQFQIESKRLIKYFLAALTTPEHELWVNLSPFEENRMIPESLGKTDMGIDLLAQDYMLKQLTSSMMYPDEQTGKKFWQKVHQLAYEKFGSSDIPMNTFNKIWIVPEKAVIFEQNNSAVIVESKLKVMLEEDYLALENHQAIQKHGQTSDQADVITGASLDVVREVLIPEIEKEVNEGKTFAHLRQIYHAVILANWYKENLKGSLIEQVYVDRNKTEGVETQDKTLNKKIYAQYVESFKKGVYNFIKEDYDSATKQTIPRQYFSGGGDFTKINNVDEALINEGDLTPQQKEKLAERGNRNVTVKLNNSDKPVYGEIFRADGTSTFIERLDPTGGQIKIGSGAYIYGEKVVKAKWYQQNLEFDLNGVVETINPNGQDVILDASAGTGGAGLKLIELLKRNHKKIRKLVLVDVGYGLSRGYMEYARAVLNTSSIYDVIDEIEFYILGQNPEKMKDEFGADEFALVSDIPGLKADHVIMENAVHLIPKSQLVRTFKGIREAMNPQAIFTMGSGDIQGITWPENFPKNLVGIHTLFDYTSDEIEKLMNENKLDYESLKDLSGQYKSVYERYFILSNDKIVKEKRAAVFPASNNQSDILEALQKSGYDVRTDVKYRYEPLEEDDYGPFIKETSYAESKVAPEFAKISKTEDPLREVREEVINRGYKNLFAKNEVYNLSWAKFTAKNSDLAMLSEDFIQILEESLAADGEGEVYKLGDDLYNEIRLDREYILAHRAEYIEGIQFLREALYKQRGWDLKRGASVQTLANITSYQLTERAAYVLLVGGRLLGFWKIFPEDLLDEKNAALAYEADRAGINYPSISKVDASIFEPAVNGAGDKSMLSTQMSKKSPNEKDLGGIDLDPNLFKVEHKGEQSLVFPKFNGSHHQIHINGLAPTIINVIPITNLSSFLKLSNRIENDVDTVTSNLQDLQDSKPIEHAHLSLTVN